jgi:hypothetical protein
MGRKNIKRNKEQYTRYQVMPSSYSNSESQYNPNSYYAGDPIAHENAIKKMENQELVHDQQDEIQKAGFEAEEKTVNALTMPGMLTRTGKALKTFNTARAGFNATKVGLEGYEAAKLGFNVKKRLDMGESAWKLKQSMDRVKNVKDVGVATTAVKGGTTLSTGVETAKTGTALGAGWKALGHAGKANIIGTAASFLGQGLKKTKWGNDKDDTTYKTGEIASDVLQYGGQGAAWGSYLGPWGTAAGAVIGSAYGLWKGFRNRNKARKLESDQKATMKKLESKAMRAEDGKFLVSRGNDTGRPVAQAY